MAKSSKMNAGVIMAVAIGLLFVCIGVEGICGSGSNGLYKAIDVEALNIILGILLVISGAALIIPCFSAGLPDKFVRIAMIFVTVVWVLVIVFSDFVYGLRGVSGVEWFSWLEHLIFHLLTLLGILTVTAPALSK
ncbi:MAG: hypothetical protein IJ831_03575 [Spirochaetales bacterium]|nr:hypothetical protein [Spirochaetales bacterium]